MIMAIRTGRHVWYDEAYTTMSTTRKLLLAIWPAMPHQLPTRGIEVLDSFTTIRTCTIQPQLCLVPEGLAKVKPGTMEITTSAAEITQFGVIAQVYWTRSGELVGDVVDQL